VCVCDNSFQYRTEVSMLLHACSALYRNTALLHIRDLTHTHTHTQYKTAGIANSGQKGLSVLVQKVVSVKDLSRT